MGAARAGTDGDEEQGELTQGGVVEHKGSLGECRGRRAAEDEGKNQWFRPCASARGIPAGARPGGSFAENQFDVGGAFHTDAKGVLQTGRELIEFELFG